MDIRFDQIFSSYYIHSLRFTLGVNDLSSCPSLTSDEILTDQDRSSFGDNSILMVPEEQQIEDDIDTATAVDDDDDSFEVLSFEALPENTLYVKGFFLFRHIFYHSDKISFPRISIYNNEQSK